jgi:hypothetical protein
MPLSTNFASHEKVAWRCHKAYCMFGNHIIIMLKINLIFILFFF